MTDEQRALLPLVKKFAGDFGLVGGTAIALQIGHRRSIDFDLFTDQLFDTKKIRLRIEHFTRKNRTIMEDVGQLTMIVNGVQMTFYHFPFSIPWTLHYEGVIRMPDLLTLAAMKAFALGGRAKWKDYVDLAFIIEQYHSIAPIVARAKEIFGDEFNAKLFRGQLGYFKDVNYAEMVEYLPGQSKSDTSVKSFLKKRSTE